MGYIELYYKDYPTVTEWGQYPRFRVWGKNTLHFFWAPPPIDLRWELRLPALSPAGVDWGVVTCDVFKACGSVETSQFRWTLSHHGARALDAGCALNLKPYLRPQRPSVLGFDIKNYAIGS